MKSMMKSFVVTLVLTGLAAQASAQMRGPGPGSGGPARPQPSPGGGHDERGNRGGNGGNRNDDQDRERREREERERQEQNRRADEDRRRQDDDRRRQDQDRQRQEADRQRQEQERARQDQQRRAEEDRRREEERRNAGRPIPGPVQPNRPGPGPVRPEPNRPGPGPVVRPGDRGPVRPGYDPRDRRNVDLNRDRVRNERAMRQLEIDRYNQQRNMQREQWRRQNTINVYIDYNSIRNADRWMNRYNSWWYECQRPVYIGAPVNWYRPMPAPGMWNYYDVDVVSDNLEYLSRDVYNVMAPVSYSTPNQEYGYRLRDVLARLSNAAENFNDSVDRTYDWSDSLYDLFYLESVLSETEQTLSGYSQSYRVQSQISSMRYYVNELLWQYRNNYGY